jgi:TfoX/Sxy family transcriptional regulator of competence genes
MPYDEELAQRFRERIEGMEGVSEKQMMGGVCFMLNGHMIGGSQRTKDGEGRFLFRVGKENQAAALSRRGARVMEQGGRQMRGFIFVCEDDCDDAAMKEWISLALAYVSTLPPKAEAK